MHGNNKDKTMKPRYKGLHHISDLMNRLYAMDSGIKNLINDKQILKTLSSVATLGTLPPLMFQY